MEAYNIKNYKCLYGFWFKICKLLEWKNQFIVEAEYSISASN